MRWFYVSDKAGHVLYARRGFGEDGTLVAVYDPRRPYGVSVRRTPEECRALYTLGRPLPADLNGAVESRFMWELHR